jgi:hypothetical protein
MGENRMLQADGHMPEQLAERRERLAYLADMLNELQTMASREDCETLAGLLALAHAEAMRKATGVAG